MRSVVLFLLIAAPSAAQMLPQGWKAMVPEKWGGLNLILDSTNIDGDAQDAQNVLTDSGYLEKRPGNVLLTTILAGVTTPYINEWNAPNGTRYLIAQASSTVYQTNLGGSPTAISTIAIGNIINTAPAFSKLYFADGNRQLWSWDDVSTATVYDPISGSSAPVCTYLDTKDTRVYCGNIPNESASRVRVSSTGAAYYWTQPPNFASVDNAPTLFDINPDDGDQINCLKTTPWGVYVGKRYSSYMIKGTGNLTYELRVVDPKIGCVDNRSVQMVYGVLKWLAVDGVYGFDGSGPPRLLSWDIDPLIKKIRQGGFGQNQWTTQLAADWATGTTSSGTPQPPLNTWNILNPVGSAFPSSNTLSTSGLNLGSWYMSDVDTTSVVTTFVSNFDNSSLASGLRWFDNPAGPDGNIYASLNELRFDTISNGARGYAVVEHSTGTWSFVFMSTAGCATNGIAGVDYFFVSSTASFFAANANGYDLRLACADTSGSNLYSTVGILRDDNGVLTTLKTSYLSSGNCLCDSAYHTLRVTRWTNGFMTAALDGVSTATATDATYSTSTYNLVVNNYVGGNLGTSVHVDSITVPAFYNKQVSKAFDTGAAAPLFGAYQVTMTTSATSPTTFYAQISGDASSWGTLTTLTPSAQVSFSGNKRYFRHSITPGPPSDGTLISSVTAVTLTAISTGYYYSQVDFIGTTISAWRQFNVSETNPGRYNYAIRATTYSFPAGNATIPWTSQTANQTITIATGSYVQWRLDSTALTNADNAEPISSVIVRWVTGSAVPLASGTLDRRYYLCVAISSVVTAPDTCLLQQKNGKWMKWIGPLVGSMGIYNYNLIVSDGGTTGKVWQIMQTGVFNDDGAAIDGYWVSTDYTDGLIFNNKILHEIWADALPVQKSSVTISYQTDKSNTWIDYQFSLDNGQGVNLNNLNNSNALFGSLNKYIPLASGTAIGKYLRVKIEDNQSNDYYRINSYLLYVEDEPRTIP